MSKRTADEANVGAAEEGVGGDSNDAEKGKIVARLERYCSAMQTVAEKNVREQAWVRISVSLTALDETTREPELGAKSVLCHFTFPLYSTDALQTRNPCIPPDLNKYFHQSPGRVFSADLYVTLLNTPGEKTQYAFKSKEMAKWDARSVYVHSTDPEEQEWCVHVGFVDKGKKKELYSMDLQFDHKDHPNLVKLLEREAVMYEELRLTQFAQALSPATFEMSSSDKKESDCCDKRSAKQQKTTTVASHTDAPLQSSTAANSTTTHD
jgi:hypothetical protein